MWDSKLKVCYMGTHFRTHIVQGKQEQMFLGKAGIEHLAVDQSECAEMGLVGMGWDLLDSGLVQECSWSR